jgi:pimeloyl-ACP methyl ester carboxylesterase
VLTWGFTGRDGARPACREVGSGRPLSWLHGFMSPGARMLEYGPVTALAERGHRVILPDLRERSDADELAARLATPASSGSRETTWAP